LFSSREFEGRGKESATHAGDIVANNNWEGRLKCRNLQTLISRGYFGIGGVPPIDA
jgi:hypothetical protein